MVWSLIRYLHKQTIYFISICFYYFIMLIYINNFYLIVFVKYIRSIDISNIIFYYNFS